MIIEVIDDKAELSGATHMVSSTRKLVEMSEAVVTTTHARQIMYTKDCRLRRETLESPSRVRAARAMADPRKRPGMGPRRPCRG